MNTIKGLGGEGILTPSDIVAFSEAEKRILELMEDGGWYCASDVIHVSKQREGLRRLRNFRDKGFSVERRKQEASEREFEYRLVREEGVTAVQLELPKPQTKKTGLSLKRIYKGRENVLAMMLDCIRRGRTDEVVGDLYVKPYRRKLESNICEATKQPAELDVSHIIQMAREEAKTSP